MLPLSRKPSNAVSRQASLPTTGSLTIASTEQHRCAVEDAEEELRNKLHTAFLRFKKVARPNVPMLKLSYVEICSLFKAKLKQIRSSVIKKSF